MVNLTESQKDLLRFLVNAVREKQLPEEFQIIWATNTPVFSNSKIAAPPTLRKMSLDALASERMLFQQPHMSSFGRDKTPLESLRTVAITPLGFSAVDLNFNPTPDIRVNKPPVEISESLGRFRADYPEGTKMAFVIMQFDKTPAHTSIVAGIRAALDHHGLVALRADDKQYHDDLYFNILTYIYGCQFGIAVFERITQDNFNPNVALEVGYMMGIGKAVCLLKDSTVKTLQTDLAGKLYRPFDVQSPTESIPPLLYAWMDDKGFIVRH